MKRYVLCCAALLSAGCCLADSGKLTWPDRSALELYHPGGWSFQLRYRSDTRELKAGPDVAELQAARLCGRAAWELLPFLTLRAEAGWCRADLDAEEGEGGLTWSAGLRANLFEYVPSASPVLGKRQSIKLGLDAEYARCVSNFEDTDFEWAETTITPLFSYTVNLRGPEHWPLFDPVAAGLFGGLVFSYIDADRAGGDLSENRDFGFLAGVNVRLAPDIVLELDTRHYAAGDASTSVSVGYRF